MTEEHKKKKKNEAPQRRFSKLKWADMFFEETTQPSKDGSRRYQGARAELSDAASQRSIN